MGRKLNAFRGVAFALFSGFFSSCGAAFVKSINDIHSLEIVIFRFEIVIDIFHVH